MSALGDRRSSARLEVLGSLRATAEFRIKARVANISQTGALIESPHAVPVNATQILHFLIDGELVPVEAVVRCVRPAAAPTPRYLVGVEFVSVPIAFLHRIEQWATPSPGHTTGGGLPL